ncbi:hypothetical protein M446_1924 [Methylobacterium sp. 4-46]|nr:hypothetical protein M446_1924 [Methylobacterium sp. 4-46]
MAGAPALNQGGAPVPLNLTQKLVRSHLVDGRPDPGEEIEIAGIAAALQAGREIVAIVGGKRQIQLRHDLSRRQTELLLKGGVINWLRERLGAGSAQHVA